MLARLKQYRAFVICTFIVLCCSIVDLYWQRGQAPSCKIGLARGYLGTVYLESGFLLGPDNPYPGFTFWKFRWHYPAFGALPSMRFEHGFAEVALPLWLYYGVALGWIALSKRRAERMRTAEGKGAS